MAVPAPDASTDSSWSQWLQLNMTSITAQLLLSLWTLMLSTTLSPLFAEGEKKVSGNTTHREKRTWRGARPWT